MAGHMAPHGAPMAPHGAPMAHPWRTHGTPWHLMAPHGASWCTHVVPMAPHGASWRLMAHPWRTHGAPMAHPWRLMAYPWCLMAYPWRTHGASWRTHGASCCHDLQGIGYFPMGTSTIPEEIQRGLGSTINQTHEPRDHPGTHVPPACQAFVSQPRPRQAGALPLKGDASVRRGWERCTPCETAEDTPVERWNVSSAVFLKCTLNRHCVLVKLWPSRRMFGGCRGDRMMWALGAHPHRDPHHPLNICHEGEKVTHVPPACQAFVSQPRPRQAGASPLKGDASVRRGWERCTPCETVEDTPVERWNVSSAVFLKCKKLA